MKLPWQVITFLTFFLILLPIFAFAQDTQPSASQLVWESAFKAAIPGPSDVRLGDQAVIHLPSTMTYIPKVEASAVMRMLGNTIDERFYGLVFSQNNNENWFMSIDYTAEGYVKDDEAASWKPDELLQSIRNGTEEGNKDRVKQGLPPLDVLGWAESPSYDSSNHRLVWSIKAVDRGAAPNTPTTINYNTYALGRDGYFEINLVTTDTTIQSEKRYAREVLAALEYSPGKRYEDFNASTDHIAEYGLAALIGGVAAKKLGLLAIIGLFLAKFAKVILIGGAVIGGSLVKFFFRKRSSNG
jgi:uncharacterized membrane-anchored protein